MSVLVNETDLNQAAESIAGAYHYRWEWHLKSSPEQLWPLVADTNRFDKDTGLPAYDEPEKSSVEGLTNTRRRLKIKLYGIPLEWIEEPFEWIRPYRFGVIRNYLPGPFPLLQPLKQLRAAAQLRAKPEGGTHLIYDVWATPRNWLGHLAIPLQIGQIYARRFDQTFRAYDELAAKNQTFLALPKKMITLPDGAQRRVATLQSALVAAGHDAGLVKKLIDHILMADDLTLSQIRPYFLADHWQVTRQAALKLMLEATRMGLLDFRWELLCPMCRVGKGAADHLDGITQTVHCDTCNVDYQANFDQSVELTFSPNPAIRQIAKQVAFCTSGPEATPHITLQQLLLPESSRTVSLQLETGRYRIRASQTPGGQLIQVRENGRSAYTFDLNQDGWDANLITLSPHTDITIENHTAHEQLFVLERVAWADHAVTAAEVTTLQTFRDLFAEEALRPGDQISVGSLTILFTDLRDSTRLYRDIGDAPAFGLVMDHFDVLREAIAAENGAIVKTIGDAVMAVFLQPVAAMRAVHAAQLRLAEMTSIRPLLLKAAIHHGPSIAVTLNERLDYFGSTVNIAARLEKFSQGGDIIISDHVFQDPAVQDWLDDNSNLLVNIPFASELRGFDNEHFTLHRLALDESV